uniref:Uncharacterized protein n=1 Tax=Arundo donax TaxID=35708 RepID=A0A0A9B3R0_ARUDO
MAEKMEKSGLTPDIGDNGDRVLQRFVKGWKMHSAGCSKESGGSGCEPHYSRF